MTTTMKRASRKKKKLRISRRLRTKMGSMLISTLKMTTSSMEMIKT